MEELRRKARAYDKVVGKLKQFMAQGVDPLITRADVQDFFPELKESEDEKIRKLLIRLFTSNANEKFDDVSTQEIIAWLEKQGEQKPMDKVEPKFKIKLAGREYNVLEIKESAGVTFYGIEDEPNHIDYVLSDDCEIISGYGVKEKGNSYPTKSATFSEQTSAWNEEDEKNLKRAIWYVEHSAINVVKDTMLSEWLKSIKERVQPQPKQEWSEEDEKMLDNCINALGDSSFDTYEIEEWVKSLKKRTGLTPEQAHRAVEIAKDAFIEKAVNYLNSKLYDWVQIEHPNPSVSHNTILKQDFIEEFKNYMNYMEGV